MRATGKRETGSITGRCPVCGERFRLSGGVIIPKHKARARFDNRPPSPDFSAARGEALRVEGTHREGPEARPPHSLAQRLRIAERTGRNPPRGGSAAESARLAIIPFSDQATVKHRDTREERFQGRRACASESPLAHHRCCPPSGHES